MKRAVAAVLAVMTLLTLLSGCAQTKHYIKPEEFQIYYYPQSKDDTTQFAAGTNSLQIIMNTPTVEAGTGKISIYKMSDDSLFAQYDIRTDKNIYVKTDNTAVSSTIVVLLTDNKVFEPGESYYVTIDEKTFYVNDLGGFSGAVNKGDWVIHIANFGIDGNINDLPDTYLVGDTIELPILVNDPAAQAVLTIADETYFGAETRSLSSTGKFEVTAKKAGTSQVSIMYLDKDGKWLDSTLFTFTVK